MHTLCTQPMEPITETRAPHSRHGEELIRARYSPNVADHGFEWPQTGVLRESFRDTEVIVSRIDGVVAGRAILDMAFYPLAELENLEVSPPFRGRGVGNAIVRQAVEVTSRAGFLAIHAQTSKDNVSAQRLYAAHGFTPATRGEMLRVWRFLNLPVLSQFLYDHPMALPGSSRLSDREHILRWFDTGSDDELAVTLRGGSCQSDSDGIGPSVVSLRLRSSPVRLTGTVTGDESVKIGGTCGVGITLVNEGDGMLTGGFRFGLNPGFRTASDYPGGERFSIRPGAAVERTVEITCDADFPVATLGICAYPSVPITVDFLLGDNTFWLTTQARVDQAG